MENIVHLIDNMEFMKNIPDKYYDLAIVDPEYGIGENWKKDKNSSFYKHNTTYKNKKTPSEKYFNQLFRVSKNQIIWGGNYYTEYLKPSNHWIVWDKDRDQKKQFNSEGELAWHSFRIPLRIVKLIWNGCCVCEKRYGFHPHEKPVALYKWLLKNYAKPGQTIFDSHVGSGSSRIACYEMGFDFEGCELDIDYFNAQEERFKNCIANKELFNKEEIQKHIYCENEIF